jgi:tetratricopeptide (TPR) repeat protein
VNYISDGGVGKMSDDPALTHFDYYRRAKAHEKNGRYEEALSEYARAIQLQNDYAHAWFYKGKLHYQLGQYRDCVNCAEKALELAPDWSEHCMRMLSDARSRLLSS